MRIALFSDIHGDVVALKTVLAHIKHIGGVDRYFAIGDILSPGPGAEDVLDLLRTHDTYLLRGNWDELFINPTAHIAKLPSEMHEPAWRYYDWLVQQLSPTSLQLLAALPIDVTIDLGPACRLYLCHATPTNTSSDTCTQITETACLRHTYGSIPANIIAYGHYHAHHLIYLDNKLLLNVASIGMTFRKPSSWTLLEYTDERVAIHQFHVPYDKAAYEQLMQHRRVPPL